MAMQYATTGSGSAAPPPTYNTSYTPTYSQTPQQGYVPNVSYIPGTNTPVPLPGGQMTNPLWVSQVADYLATAWANGWRGFPGGWDATFGLPNENDADGVATAATIGAFSRYAYNYKPGMSQAIDSMFPYVAPGPNDYVESPAAIAARVAQANADRDFAYGAQRDAVSDARWQASFDAENASRQMSNSLQAQGLSLQAANQAADQAYRMAQLAMDEKQLTMQGQHFDREMAFKEMSFAAQQAIQQAQLEIQKGELAIRAQEQGVKRAATLAQFGQNPGDAVARELFLQQGAAGLPTGTPVDIFSGKVSGAPTTFDALQRAQASKLAPFSQAGMTGAGAMSATGVSAPLPVAAAPAPAPVPPPQLPGQPELPRFAHGGGTLARQFITGDPQQPGVPNPELTMLETRGAPDVAHVIPLGGRSMDRRYPMYAEGTDSWAEATRSLVPPPVTDYTTLPPPSSGVFSGRSDGTYIPYGGDNIVRPLSTDSGGSSLPPPVAPPPTPPAPSPAYAERAGNIPLAPPSPAGPSPYDATSWAGWTAPDQSWTTALQHAGYADQFGRLRGAIPTGWTPDAYTSGLANSLYGGGNLYTNSPYGGPNLQVGLGTPQWWDAISKLSSGMPLQQAGYMTGAQYNTALGQAAVPTAPGANGQTGSAATPPAGSPPGPVLTPQQQTGLPQVGQVYAPGATTPFTLPPGAPPGPQMVTVMDGPAAGTAMWVNVGADGSITVTGVPAGQGGQTPTAPASPVGGTATGLVPYWGGWWNPANGPAPAEPTPAQIAGAGPPSPGVAGNAATPPAGPYLPPGIPTGATQVGAPAGSQPGMTYWQTPSGVFMQSDGTTSRPYAPTAPATPAGGSNPPPAGGGASAGGGFVPWYNQPPTAPPAAGASTPPPAAGGSPSPRPETGTPGTSGWLAQLMAALGAPAGISSLMYGNGVYQNLAQNLLSGDPLSLGSSGVEVPALGLTGANALTSPSGLNLANLVQMQQQAPGAFALLGSLYGAGNQSLGDILARLQARAPQGNAWRPSLIQTV